MELAPFFKAIVDSDNESVVVCDLDHTIIYMNPAAIKSYSKRGGAALVGRSVLDCHAPGSVESIKKIAAWFAESEEHNSVFTGFIEKKGMDYYIIALRDESGKLISYYERHCTRTRESGKPYDMN